MPTSAETDENEDALDVIWGAERIGRIIRRTERQVNHLLDIGALPGARKVGGRWCITRRALFAAFDDAPTPEVPR